MGKRNVYEKSPVTDANHSVSYDRRLSVQRTY